VGKTGVISQLVDGDGWQTWITLSNLDATPSQYLVSFIKDDGSPLSLQTSQGSGTYVYGVLPARGTVTIKTAGTNTALAQGWAKMETVFANPLTLSMAPGANVAGTVLFLRPPNVPRPTEASEPLDYSSQSRWVLPFDHTNGHTTGVALVNPLPSDLSVSITFYDESGVQVQPTDTFTILSGHHTAIVLTVNYPNIIGRKGSVKVETTAASINVLGLRITPAGEVSGTSPTSW
jgi:hypothetical protein